MIDNFPGPAILLGQKKGGLNFLHLSRNPNGCCKAISDSCGRPYGSQPFFIAANRWLDAILDRRSGIWRRRPAVTGDAGSDQTRRPMELSGLAHGSLPGGRRVAQAVAGHPSLARPPDLR